jgi:hypothetical protein
LTVGRPRRRAWSVRRARPLLLAVGLALQLGACDPPDSQFPPDEVLRTQLGLTSKDEVHRVTLTGGDTERAEPAVVSIGPGAYVEFITDDWLVHEVNFEQDSLSSDQWAFLQRTDQVDSPPLLQRESRYVLRPDDTRTRSRGTGRPATA